nr:hypothetical protein [Staphylothermus hellenicus]
MRSLFDAKIHREDTCIVYSYLDTILIARRNPLKKHAFLAVGLETTMPTAAVPL